jgi:hypothetical protein
MKRNKILEDRYCVDCKEVGAVLWYTKRGRMEVMCLKCGKSWSCYAEGCPKKVDD